jgi:hypothetical protein
MRRLDAGRGHVSTATIPRRRPRPECLHCPVGIVLSYPGAFGVRRVVSAWPSTRAADDDLARLSCGSTEVVPGSSLYIFPTETSFDKGFEQFVCLAH